MENNNLNINKKQSKSLLMIGSLIVLIIVIIAGLSALFLQDSNNSKKNSQNNATASATSTPIITQTVILTTTVEPTVKLTITSTPITTSTPIPSIEPTISKTFVLGKSAGEQFPYQTITLNGLKSNEVLSAQNGDTTFTLKSPDFIMTFISRYEDFPQSYKSAVAIVQNGANQIYRVLMKEDTSNTWVYVKGYGKTGTCEYITQTIPAPCGGSIYSKGTGYFEVNVRANNTAGLKRADEIVKMLTAKSSAS